MNERSSLLQQPSSADPKYAKTTTDDEARNSRRFFVWRRQDCLDFLEGQTPAGKIYERFMIVLIGANVLALIVGSLFVEQYTKNPGKVNDLTTAAWSRVWDALLFGNHADNGLQSLHLGATSLLELVSVLIFTLDYMGRIGTADLIVVPFSSTDQVKYLFGPPGWRGRFRWMFSFYSIVDLATILPFYCDVLLLRHSDMTASLFLRMFRLLRMMRSQGSSSTTPIYSNDPLATQQHPQATIKHYDSAWSMIDDILAAQKSVLITTGFVGVTVWIAVSSLYYLAERRNLAMVYCPVCYNEDEDNTDDTINFTRVTNNNNQRELDPFSDCTIDSWGNVDCGEHCNGCYHLYESIPMASYYALLNLFGEFPHIETHSTYGKAVAVFTSVVAVAVFALPVGIVGNGVKDVVLAQRKKKSNSNYSSSSSATALQEDANEIQEEGGMTFGFYAVDNMLRGQIYNVLHSQTARGALAFDAFINILIVSTAISFMLDTVDGLPDISHIFFDSFELISVTIFTVEYIFRVYSAKEDPKYSGSAGRIKYMITFLSLIDLLSFLPYWIEFVALRGNVISSTSSTGSDIVKSLRLLRIFRFERYTHAFLTFDDVFTRNRDILEVTAFTAILFWVFFSACLYLTERDSLDAEIASNYSTVPNSMWITLLNLSGESPLSQYSAWGKIITAVLGLVATG